jgi:hypothetical protein
MRKNQEIFTEKTHNGPINLKDNTVVRRTSRS